MKIKSTFLLFLVALSEPFIVNTNISTNNKNNIYYLENFNSHRESLIRKLEINKEKQNPIFPNGNEPSILIEEIGNEGNIPLLSKITKNPVYITSNKIIGEIKSSNKCDNFWEDTHFYLNNILICTKRKVYNLSSNSSFLEGILNSDGSIITDNGNKYNLFLDYSKKLFIYELER